MTLYSMSVSLTTVIYNCYIDDHRITINIDLQSIAIKYSIINTYHSHVIPRFH